MSTDNSKTYTYTRAGESFTVGPAGIRLINVDGTVEIDRSVHMPDYVIAETVVELVFAGWVSA